MPDKLLMQLAHHDQSNLHDEKCQDYQLVHTCELQSNPFVPVKSKTLMLEELFNTFQTLSHEKTILTGT